MERAGSAQAHTLLTGGLKSGSREGPRDPGTRGLKKLDWHPAVQSIASFGKRLPREGGTRPRKQSR